MRMKNRIEKGVLYDYREWLVSFVDTEDLDFSRNYTCLMDQLFHTKYRWVIDMDQDRYIDGLDMRKKYEYETGNDISSDIMIDCSILECFVALFVKFSDTVLTDPGDISVAPELFFDALSHLGLLFYDDNRYDSYAVDDIIERFLDCKIQLFSVSFCKKNVDLYMLTGKYSMEKW